MDLDEDNEQKRKDFNNIIFLNTTLSGAAKFNLCASLTRMQEHMLEDRCCKYCDQTFASRTEKLSHKKYMCKQHEIILGQSVDLHINTYKNLYENATAKVTKPVPVPCSEKSKPPLCSVPQALQYKCT